VNGGRKLEILSGFWDSNARLLDGIDDRTCLAYLRSLPALWADSGLDGRQVLALALFARTEVIGFEQMSYQLTPEAIELGLNAALPPVYELRASIAEFGRGERI
jgi:hypothetical protein